MHHVEGDSPNMLPSRISTLIQDNFDWVMGGKGQFKSSGYPFEVLVEPSLEYALSLCIPEDRDKMRASYQNRLSKIESAEEKFRAIAGDVIADWHKNMP